MMCSTCSVNLRKGASFCAVCGRKAYSASEAAPLTASRTTFADAVVRVLLIACVTLLAIPVLLSVGCLALL